MSRQLLPASLAGFGRVRSCRYIDVGPALPLQPDPEQRGSVTLQEVSAAAICGKEFARECQYYSGEGMVACRRLSERSRRGGALEEGCRQLYDPAAGVPDRLLGELRSVFDVRLSARGWRIQRGHQES